MALHLNLYHEVEKQKALNRRDPLKIAMAGLGVAAAGFAGYYALQLNTARVLGNELRQLQAEYADLKPKAEAAQKKATEIDVTMKQGEALMNRMEKRFYWAPILDSLVQLAPKEVQFTRLTGEVTGEETRRCTISLDGLAAGADPRKVAEELRQTLVEHFSARFSGVTATFRSLEDSPEPVAVGAKKIPTASFGINLVMERSEKAPEEAARTAQK